MGVFIFFLNCEKQSFKLEKSSGKKSFTLSARELSITWSNNPMYWSWVPTNESRFVQTNNKAMFVSPKLNINNL